MLLQLFKLYRNKLKKIKVINDNRITLENQYKNQLDQKEKELIEINNSYQNLKKDFETKEKENKQIIENSNKLKNSISINQNNDKKFNEIIQVKLLI